MKTNQRALLDRPRSVIESQSYQHQNWDIATPRVCALGRAVKTPADLCNLKALERHRLPEPAGSRGAGLAHPCSREVSWRKSRDQSEGAAAPETGALRGRLRLEPAPSVRAHVAHVSHAGGGAGIEVRGVARGEDPYSIVRVTLDDASEVAYIHGESLGATPADDPEAPEGPDTRPGWTRELLDMRKAVLQSQEGIERKQRQIAEALADPNQLYLVAKNQKGAVIGFCVAIRGERQNTLTMVYVHPNYWRRDIGRSLVQAAIDWGNPDLPFAVRTTPTHPSVLFYERLGFEVVPDSAHQLPVGDDAQVWQIRMERRL